LPGAECRQPSFDASAQPGQFGIRPDRGFDQILQFRAGRQILANLHVVRVLVQSAFDTPQFPPVIVGADAAM
jgi:hypothetical protein